MDPTNGDVKMETVSLTRGCVMALTTVETIVMSLFVLVWTKSSVATTRNVFPIRGPVTARMTVGMEVMKSHVKVTVKILLRRQQVKSQTIRHKSHRMKPH